LPLPRIVLGREQAACAKQAPGIEAKNENAALGPHDAIHFTKNFVRILRKLEDVRHHAEIDRLLLKRQAVKLRLYGGSAVRVGRNEDAIGDA
jgi:hypothetical protein